MIDKRFNSSLSKEEKKKARDYRIKKCGVDNWGVFFQYFYDYVEKKEESNGFTNKSITYLR